MAAVEHSVSLSELTKVDGLVGPKDLTVEIYREYEFASGRVYRVSDPVALYFRKGGTTHRIVDRKGVVHCIPFPGEQGDVILRWVNRTGSPVVGF